MRIGRLHFALFIVAVMVTAAPARAQQMTAAPPTSHLQAIIAGAVAGGVDLAFITYDLTLSGLERKPSYLGGAIELTVMVLQLSIGISLAAYGGTRGDDLLIPVGALMAGVAVPLALHGYWAMNHAAPANRTSLLVVPAPISDGQRVGWGVAAMGRF
jgi:hypothetical protein